MTPHYPSDSICVVLLAAGRGERMRPLTDHTPKPLLRVAGRALIEHHLYRLAEQGFTRAVINVAHLGEQLIETLGDGARYGLSIRYSDERDTGALETAGGIHKALTLIDSDPFLVINADIWTDFDFRTALSGLAEKAVGRLVLVDNPAHNSGGDFSIDEQGMLSKTPTAEKFTFSGIAVYRREMFHQVRSGKLSLAPLLHEMAAKQSLQAIKHEGNWTDVGSPERLASLSASQG